MSKALRYTLLYFAVIALALGLRHHASGRHWRFVLATTGIQVPTGALISPVDHSHEVIYAGTIDLPSAAAVQTFIAANNLKPLRDHLDADGNLHRGTLAPAVPREQYATTHLLLARSSYYTWEFVLDDTTRRVRYELHVPDYAGDLP